MHPTSRSTRLSACLICLILIASTGRGQAPPTVQVFMPDGSLPSRELRFKLVTDDGRVDVFFTDSKGRFPITRKEGLRPDAGYTLTFETDRYSYETTTVSFKLYNVYYIPVFLQPLKPAEPPAPAAVSVEHLAQKTSRWEKQPYTEWSEREALELMNDSPWGQTQIVTDTSGAFGTGRRMDSGQSRISDVPQLNLRIRFISAKPMRQAISRYMELQQPGNIGEQLAAQLQAFANADFPDYIVVTVSCESSAPSALFQQATALLNGLATSELQNSTFLLAKGGQRLFLQEYQTPRKDGTGARFIFPRTVDGKPFLTPESGEVQFYSELGNGLKVSGKPVALSMRWKVKDMMFQGKLEY